MCKTCTIPSFIKNYLGLGLKFCPNPKFSLTSDKADTSRLHDDYLPHVFFNSGEEESTFNKPALYVPLGWDVQSKICKIFKKHLLRIPQTTSKLQPNQVTRKSSTMASWPSWSHCPKCRQGLRPHHHGQIWLLEIHLSRPPSRLSHIQNTVNTRKKYQDCWTIQHDW